jgi:hypothetical protein
MSKPEYIVEILICNYEDDQNWKANGRVLSSFYTKEEADELADRLVIEASNILVEKYGNTHK